MLYDICFLLFSIFYLPTLLFKGKLHGDFAERFCRYDEAKRRKLSAGNNIWIQAVSVGEVSLCKNLIPLIKKKFPAHNIVLSTITKTGNALARKLFADNAEIIYFPLDFSFTAKKAVNIIRPKIYIMVETEVWPNVLRQLRLNSIPCVLVNGRISDRSFGKYKLARPFLKNTLTGISTFCMQSEEDARRIVCLGAPQDKVKVTGNMKFDSISAIKAASATDTRKALGLEAGDELFVAGSTHDGEEEIILSVYKNLVRDFHNLRLLIAPRHIDRCLKVEAMVKDSGLLDKRIIVLNTIGQLNDIYSIATLVFIGGSLVRHGGQNPIEPAVFEKPVMFGPYMFNFKNISKAFLEKGGAVQVSGWDDLLERSRFLLDNPAERIKIGQNAKKVVTENRGATENNLKVITDNLRSWNKG